ncbi:hypothetical protein TNCV_1264811 [Trichonephila clavipes]|nr:hypothetical protein TNCV_1264811 [Trichonephila clavipes]
MKQEMQLFDTTEIPSPNIIKLCDALKTIPPTSVEAERAFFSAGLFETKLRTRLSDKKYDIVILNKVKFKSQSGPASRSSIHQTICPEGARPHNFLVPEDQEQSGFFSPFFSRIDPFKLQGWVTYTPLATSYWLAPNFALSTRDSFAHPWCGPNNDPGSSRSPPQQRLVHRLDCSFPLKSTSAVFRGLR